MKILVFDDNPICRDAARAQLKDHELTVVGTYDEAQEVLTPKFDPEKGRQILPGLLTKAGLPPGFNPRRNDSAPSEEDKAKYYAACEEARKMATTYPGFDVVLSDLLVPASKQEQGSSALVGKKMPVGIFIGLLAAVKGRAKYIAVFTDSGHHDHPASACFDAFNANEDCPTAFTVEGSKVLLSNNRCWIQALYRKDLSKVMDWDEYFEDREKAERITVRAKNWSVLLDYLLKQ